MVLIRFEKPTAISLHALAQGYLLAKAVLRGLSQVILVENALSGLLILTGIAIASWELGLAAALSALVGTAAALLLGAERELVNKGVFGYNAVLTGIAMMHFMQGDGRWWAVLLGALISAVFAAALMKVLALLKLPVLTFPFIVTSWFALLAAYRLNSMRISPGLIPTDLQSLSGPVRETSDLLGGVIRGVGQVYLENSMWTGVLILLALWVAGWKFGLAAIIGSGGAWLMAWLVGADTSWLNMGLYGYNAVLTMLAVSLVFAPEGRWAPVSGTAAALVSVPVAAGLSVCLAPYGLPAFTMPFTLTAWMWLSAAYVLPGLRAR